MDEDTINDLDINKITLKHYSEKKTSRTYIIGLDKFITDKKALDDFCKKLKKKLATSCLEKEDNGKKIYGFQGQHQDKIRNFIIENKIAKADDITY